MDPLRAMRVFAKVVDEGGLARAARALDMAPPVVTRLVAELQAHRGARRLDRSARRQGLAEIGEVGETGLHKVRAILLEVEESEALASQSTKQPRGHLRVWCPPSILAHPLGRHLPRFQQEFPQVTLEIDAPGPVETVDPGHDLTLFQRPCRAQR